MAQLNNDAEELGPFRLVCYDTYQAGFSGAQFNDNKDALSHAQSLRELTTLPGKPAALADYRRFGKLVAAGMVGNAAPGIAIVDYSAIDSGLGGPPYPVTVVGVDRTENWSGLDGAAYDAKRDRWRDAIVSAIDSEFPGFATKVVASALNTASTMSTYLNAPGGAIYGFAPLPPSGPIWWGFERSANTTIQGLYLASAYAFSGAFTGAIIAGEAAADLVLASRP
jgi:hypothetical protein